MYVRNQFLPNGQADQVDKKKCLIFRHRPGLIEKKGFSGLSYAMMTIARPTPVVIPSIYGPRVE